MNYLFKEDLSNDHFIIDGDEFIHGIKSLRKKVSDHIFVVDGKGNLIKATIDQIDKRSAICSVVERKMNYLPLPYQLTMAIAPPKNSNRWEWMLEKCTEIGCSQFIPIVCARSERKIIKLDRSNRIIRSAMKQSLKTYLPQLSRETDINQLLEANNTGLRLICTGSAQSHFLDVVNRESQVQVVIGPEGDFTPEEIEKALASGYQAVNLGTQRLRTETAAVVATTLYASQFNQK